MVTRASQSAVLPIGPAVDPGRRRARGARRLLATGSARSTVGALLLAVVALVALLADLLAPYDPLKQDYNAILGAPDVAHWLGTDALGRDVFSRVMLGSRVSLLVGVLATLGAVGLGVPLGMVAGYVGGLVDDVVMRTMDALWSAPAILLALGITAVLGPSATNAMIAIGVVYTPVFARLARGQTLAIREREFVQAGRALGGRTPHILLRHVGPNIGAPIIVQGSLMVGQAIITEATLSFLGVGVQPPTPSWGGMLRDALSYLGTAPWLGFFPGLAIFSSVVALNLVGDAARVALDPRLRER
jgi:peptide/nickel transport system permease protein